MKYNCPNSLELSSTPLGFGIRKAFPFFASSTSPAPAYLDSAASSQKPEVVIKRLTDYLSFEHANIHRGAYALSAEATRMYDQARSTVAAFIGAFEQEIVFTKNATEAINLVAACAPLSAGDKVLLTKLEHHSNIVPWQLASKSRGIELLFAEITAQADIDLEDLLKKISTEHPKLVACTAISNAFGTVLPIERIIAAAHEVGAMVLIDASQLVMHKSINISALEADFLVFSGHKAYGPTGVGVLYGRHKILSSMQPFLGGGDMIETVSVSGSTWADVPRRFEAGTPAIAEVIALEAALKFLSAIGVGRIEQYEDALFSKAFELLSKEPGVRIIGPATLNGKQRSILSFTVERVHPHDLASFADTHNVQIRAGHHCAMPAMTALNLDGTARASIGIYTEFADFERLIEAIRQARRVLK